MPSPEEIDGDEQVIDEVTETPETPGEPDPTEALKARLAALEGDPDVAAVLAAKQGKRALRIVVGEDQGNGESREEPAAPMPSSEELDDMTNSQLTTALMSRLGSVVEETLRKSGVLDQLGAVQETLAASRKKDLAAEASALQAKYPDLTEHKDEIVKLAGQGLKLEEAYLVSRLRKGKGLPTPKASTERPTSVTLRRVPKEEPAKMGPRGFSEDLSEVLSRLEIPGL